MVVCKIALAALWQGLDGVEMEFGWLSIAFYVQIIRATQSSNLFNYVVPILTWILWLSSRTTTSASSVQYRLGPPDHAERNQLPGKSTIDPQCKILHLHHSINPSFLFYETKAHLRVGSPLSCGHSELSLGNRKNVLHSNRPSTQPPPVAPINPQFY